MKSVVDAALRLVRCAHVQVLLLLLRGNNNGLCDRVRATRPTDTIPDDDQRTASELRGLYCKLYRSLSFPG